MSALTALCAPRSWAQSARVNLGPVAENLAASAEFYMARSRMLERKREEWEEEEPRRVRGGLHAWEEGRERMER